MSKLLVTGASPKLAQIPQRLEISTFIKDIKQFSLYILALQATYNKPITGVASYYQISGIHGMPYVDWNGSPSNGVGFCIHGTTVFAPWHRPYVALFEQEVQRNARQIASTYKVDPLGWQKAAANLRQPYWGWDNLNTFVPPDEVISMNTVEIIVPSGKKSRVQNPFLAYKFPPGSIPPFVEEGLDQLPTTVRYFDQRGQSQPGALRRALTATRRQVVSDTQRLYSLTNWEEFVEGSDSTSGLESIHNTIHVRTGGNGHMSYLASAAFDPIFYLHHAQVDRIISLWYDRHKKWETSTEDLTPFWRTQTTYWRSPAISDSVRTFNYRYGPAAIRKQSANATMVAWMLGVPAEHPAAQNITSDQLSQFAGANGDARLTVFREWSARVRCKRFELGSSFSVYIFLAPVPTNPDEWLTHPSLAGTFDVFSDQSVAGSANASDQYMQGFVHLNYALFNYAKQPIPGNNTIPPYLTDPQHLNWAVRKLDGEVVSIDKFPSLQVTVLATPLELPAGADLPIEEQPEYFPNITHGRPGGDP